jgi:hypothetical protein
VLHRDTAGTEVEEAYVLGEVDTLVRLRSWGPWGDEVGRLAHGLVQGMIFRCHWR